MASFMSALSLFVLVVISGCFALPLGDEQSWNFTSSPFNGDLTTENVLHPRSIADLEKNELPLSAFTQSTDEHMVLSGETTFMPPVNIKRSSDEHMDLEMSTSLDGVTMENGVRVPRMFDEFSTSESFLFTPTTERSLHDKRENDELSMTTIESATHGVEFVPRGLNMDSDNETDVSRKPNKSLSDYPVSATFETFTENGQFIPRELGGESSNELAEKDMPMELSTSFMPSFTSTSSAVAPELYTTSTSSAVAPELYTTSTSSSSTFTTTSTSTPTSTTTTKSTSTSTLTSTSTSTSTRIMSTPSKGKYTGLLTDEIPREPVEQQPEGEPREPVEQQPEGEPREQPEEPKQRPDFPSTSSTTRRPKVDSDDESKDVNIPVAVFDQEALKNVSYFPNDVMILEDKNDIVTALPTKFSTTSKNIPLEQKKLNQVEESTYTEETKSDN